MDHWGANERPELPHDGGFANHSVASATERRGERPPSDSGLYRQSDSPGATGDRKLPPPTALTRTAQNNSLELRIETEERLTQRVGGANEMLKLWN